MKTKNSFKGKMGIMLLSAVCTFSGAFANEDAILNSDPIDINGYVQPAPATDHELETVRGELRRQKQAIVINKEKKKKYNELSRTTEKLADETEEMIEERKESQETIDRFNKKIDCLMNNNAGEECAQFAKGVSDSVSTKQAAPVVEAQAAPTKGKMGDVIKLLPYTGFTSIQSENESLEANLTMGLRVESDITDRFSVGLGFNYLDMQSTDFANSYSGQYRTGFNYNDYSNFYTNGREVEYSNLSFEIYTKYFITKTERFRPYLGGGLSYNRSQLNYLDNRDRQFTYGNSFNQNVAQFGDEEVISSHMKATLVGGTEIIFTKNFGMNLELQYARGLGGNLGSDNANMNNAPDQRRLQDLNDELIEANLFSVFAGVLVLF
jgi:opacity protein-like surface antigen